MRIWIAVRGQDSRSSLPRATVSFGCCCATIHRVAWTPAIGFSSFFQWRRVRSSWKITVSVRSSSSFSSSSSPSLMSHDFARSSSLLLSLPLISSRLFCRCFVSMVVAALSMRRDEVVSPLFGPLAGLLSLPASGSPLRSSFQLPSLRWLSCVVFICYRSLPLCPTSSLAAVSRSFSLFLQFSHFHLPNGARLSCIPHTLSPVFKATCPFLCIFSGFVTPSHSIACGVEPEARVARNRPTLILSYCLAHRYIAPHSLVLDALFYLSSTKY